MADHTANAMLAAIRSMREVVIPALDPAHPLAREQAGLVVKYLEFWSGRFDHVAERNRAELTAYVAMGQDLKAHAHDVSPGLEEELGKALDSARTALGHPSRDIEAVRRGVTTLTEVITALVRTATAAQHPLTDQISRIVVQRTEPVALLQRSWFGPQGWEDPLPPDLVQVLAQQLGEGAPS